MHLLFDIGGTTTRLAFGTQWGISEPILFPTPKNFEEGIDEIARRAQEHAAGEAIAGAAGGIAGPLSSDKSRMVSSPNLPGWAGKPFTEALGSRLGCLVYLENDTALVGLGEIHYGGAHYAEEPIVAYVTVSTGIGGCRFVGGKLDQAARGFEIGHHVINFSTGESLEEVASGSGILRRYGKHPKEIEDPELWREIRRTVAVGIHNLILFWSPHVVTIGGGVAGDIRFDFAACVLEIQKTMRIFPDIPNIRQAKLGDVGGLYGAKVLLDQRGV